MLQNYLSLIHDKIKAVIKPKSLAGTAHSTITLEVSSVFKTRQTEVLDVFLEILAIELHLKLLKKSAPSLKCFYTLGQDQEEN